MIDLIASSEWMLALAGRLEPLARWLAEASLKASVVGLLVLAVQRLLRDRLSPRWSHALWGLVILRLLMPALPESSASLFNLGRLAPGLSQLVPDLSGWMHRLPELAPGHPGPTTTRHAAALRAPLDAWPLAPGELQLILDIPHAAPTEPSSPFPPLLLALWLAGATLLSGRLAWAAWRMHRQLGSATPISAPWMLELLETCRSVIGIRRRVEVVTTDRVDSPALTGLLRPRLLLPEALLAGVTPPQLRFIFLHELAHLKRNDLLLNWITLILETLHWPNLFIRYAFHRMRADRELACDDLVLSRLEPAETRDYGRTIIALLERLSRPASIPGAVGILEHRQQIERRIVMIARFPGTSSRLTWPAAVLLVGLGSIALTEATPGLSAASQATVAPYAVPTLVSFPTAPAGVGVTTVAANNAASDKAATAQPVSPKVQKLQQKLENPISVALGGAPYRVALDTILKPTGAKVKISPEAEAIIKIDARVGLKATKVSAAMALKSLLSARGLEYCVTEDGIHIEKAAGVTDLQIDPARFSGHKGDSRRVVIVKDGEGVVQDQIMGLDDEDLEDGTEQVSVDADGHKVIKRVIIKHDGKDGAADPDGKHTVTKTVIIKSDGKDDVNIDVDGKKLVLKGEGPNGTRETETVDADGKKVVKKVIVQEDGEGDHGDGQKVEKRIKVIKLTCNNCPYGEDGKVLEGLDLDKDTEARIQADLEKFRKDGEGDMKSMPADGEMRLVIEGPEGQKGPDGKPVEQEKKVIIMKQKQQP